MAHGILGFVRFLKGFYLILITARKKVAQIGMHSIYKIMDTQMVPLFRTTTNLYRDEEAKYLNIFSQIKIQNGFFFSYTYDLTHSLQENILRKIRNKMGS